ncbi:MAG: FAD-dependent oxidoreductase [Candidatus Odinarchaeia archaeon]
MKIIIIGLNSAGIGAAIGARKTNYDVEITVYEKEKYTAYSRCGIPFVISGEVKSFDDLVDFPDDYYNQMAININLEHTVTKINPDKKEIEIKTKNGVKHDTYDKLIIATGGQPKLPKIKGITLQNVFTVRTIEDGRNILDKVKTSKNVVIIGAGLIGLEVADALSKLGLNVTLLELMPQILQTLLDKDMTEKILQRMKKNNVHLILNCTKTEIIGETKVEAVKALDKVIPADFVIVATAVKPNTELAEAAGILIGEVGGIKVNMRLETNIKDIYACGDCVEFPHFITRRPTLCQLGTIANSMGKVAGINAAGGYAIMNPVLIVAIVRIFGLQIGHVGFTESQVRDQGLLPIVALVSGKTKSHYFPQAKDVTVKLIFGLASNHLIGAQLVGEEDVAIRTNFLSAAITNRMTAYDLEKINIGYTPPLNSPVEPIVQAAEAANQMIKHSLLSFEPNL